jgi:hypothetical protein
MKWRKLGRVFAPAAGGDWSATHAAVPIPLRLERHRWRVYFSARDRGNRAHTGYFDTDLRRPAQLLAVSERPVLSPGGLGTFDEDGAMGSWIVEQPGRLLLYYTGWNRGISVPFRNAIGMAESDDRGLTFARVSTGPVLDRGIHDPVFTANPCVLVVAGRWRCWYLSGVAWEVRSGTPTHLYHVKYAESDDGVEWRRAGVIGIDIVAPGEIAISRPCVLRDADRYRMWYSRRGERYRMGYAESTDGIAWKRCDERVGIDVSADGWDSEMVGYAHVFDAEGGRFMLYNGNGYGATGIGLAVLEQD